MKHYFNSCLLMIGLLFTVAGCMKDHEIVDPEPEPETPSGTAALEKDVVGKWIVENNAGRTTGDDAFLEFLADGTYIIYNITETIVSGTYKVTSEKDLTLTDFGAISDVSFSGNKIICKLTYSGKSLNITAGKAALIGTDSRTQLLARSWSLTSEEDGGPLLTSDIDPNVKFETDYLFSAAGTYLIVDKFQGQIFPGVKGNWKWHSTDASRIVWWSDGSQIDENQNILVRELTKTSFKMTAKADNDIDVKLTLIPAN